MDELAHAGYTEGKTAHIFFENAQGNMVVATQIAQQFVAIHPDVIVAIATPSAQAVANAAKKTTIPQVFASISDPIQAKLVIDLKHPGGNMTGTRNVSPIDKQIHLIKQIMPNIKTIGIVLNYGEVNAVDLMKAVVMEANKNHIDVQTVAINSTADIQIATVSLVSKVDAILLLQDNTVASGLPALMKVADKNHVPVFTTYLDAMKLGAIAGMAFDEYAIGQQTGKMVVSILKGKNPSDMPVEDPIHSELVINVEVAHDLGITISPDLIKQTMSSYSASVK
jgi:putative ABC transport system substrate-binding protein